MVPWHLTLPGKTIQSLSVAWTLLKQGPFCSPIIKKALIVWCAVWLARVRC